jgi:hypothetical protein
LLHEPLLVATLHPPGLTAPHLLPATHPPLLRIPAGPLLPPNTATDTYPRDLTSAFMAAAMQQQQGQLLPHTPHTPTNQQQQALLPLLTPPQLTPSASLAAQGALQGSTAATAAAAPLSAQHTAMQAMDAFNMNRGHAPAPQSTPPPASTSGFSPAGAALLNPGDGEATGLNPAGDALQQLLSDPALMDAVLRSDMGHSNAAGAHSTEAAAAAAGARAALQAFQTTGAWRVGTKLWQSRSGTGTHGGMNMQVRWMKSCMACVCRGVGALGHVATTCIHT